MIVDEPHQTPTLMTSCLRLGYKLTKKKIKRRLKKTLRKK